MTYQAGEARFTPAGHSVSFRWTGTVEILLLGLEPWFLEGGRGRARRRNRIRSLAEHPHAAGHASSRQSDPRARRRALQPDRRLDRGGRAGPEHRRHAFTRICASSSGQALPDPSAHRRSSRGRADERTAGRNPRARGDGASGRGEPIPFRPPVQDGDRTPSARISHPAAGRSSAGADRHAWTELDHGGDSRTIAAFPTRATCRDTSGECWGLHRGSLRRRSEVGSDVTAAPGRAVWRGSGAPGGAGGFGRAAGGGRSWPRGGRGG